MYAHKRLCFDKAGRKTIGGTKQQHEKFNIFYHWICTGISSAFFMEFTVFQTAQEELQEHPERKTSATKIIIFSILATYYIAFAVGVWVVVTKDFYQLSVLLTFVGGVTAAAVAFYCWKAKAENLLKIKAAYPELSGTLSDFSSMTQ